jgi:deazaflavin-dependent oxidoreductase (nitroreductase family)
VPRCTVTKTYRVTGVTRAVNAVYASRARRGRGPSFLYVLTARGRTSGTPRSNPVDVMSEGGRRWLVAPYGETNWTRNVRVAGEATISRAGRDERVRLTELPPSERVPILRRYLEQVKWVRAYLDVTAESSDDELLAVAPGHPVFEITSLDS